ncbi:hypothetical protein AMS68_003022 [Peltaster fructicola]|uniref:Aminoglycoside phosphotransferase domain-containing protein n=1 Tax=Peltaster fructicola TaxID=286661 RepID=A0A6H0XS94_9PEZI|nr:hypothetical protein AMS68_003022 [Peltaster fructicola]
MVSLADLNFNTAAIITSNVQSALRKDRECDLETVLRQAADKYARRRKRRTEEKETGDERPNKLLCLPSPVVASEIEILVGFAPSVLRKFNSLTHDQALELPAGDLSPAQALAHVEAAIRLCNPSTRRMQTKITYVGDDIVIKSVLGRDTVETSAMQLVRKHSSIPIPDLLGAVTSGKKTFIIMSRMPGEPLSEAWSTLTPRQKSSIQEQLSVVLTTLRSIPVTADVLGCGNPSVCKDMRMYVRQSEHCIHDEREFNAFLTSEPRRRISPAYVELLRDAVLGTDSVMVMTHGDFAARNILVTKDDDKGTVELTAVLDWECAGTYPDYWEGVHQNASRHAIQKG